MWIAQFHHFRDFGLYEDDYWFISEAMGKDPGYLVARFEKVFTTLPQGRPFGFFLPDLLSWIGDRLGGLPAIYLVGFLVVVLNSFLCYRLLRLRTPALVAGAGSLAFLLFPADTTKFLLIHDFQLQPSLTFILLASLAYASGRRPLAYLLCIGSLMAYENGFLAFFALPLFLRRWNRATLRELARHILILLGLLLVVVALRFAVGEGRATSSVGSVAEIVPREARDTTRILGLVSHLVRGVDLPTIAGALERTILEELDYTREAQNIERFQQGKRSLADVRTTIRRLLAEEQRQEKTDAFVAQLRARAKIEIYL